MKRNEMLWWIIYIFQLNNHHDRNCAIHNYIHIMTAVKFHIRNAQLYSTTTKKNISNDSKNHKHTKMQTKNDICLP